MATARLIPSSSSAASGVTISSATNMYANIDSTTTAEITSTSKDTTTRYAYIKNFNFNIPSGATVTAFEIKIKGYEERLNTSSSYAPCLVNNTSAISGTTATDNFGSSDTTITIPTGSLTWSQITGYGSNFGIRVAIRRSNKNQQGYLYIYGAEIDVTYELPAVTHTVSITGTNVSPSGTQTVDEGDNLTITMSGRSVKPTVTDNSVDVSSQLVQSGTTYTYTITNVVADHTVVVSENHVVSITGTNVTPSGTQIVSDGSSLTVTMPDRASKPTVTDNGVDVTSQVVVGSASTSSATSHPVDSETDFFPTYNVGNDYTDSTSTTYAGYGIPPNSTKYIKYSFGDLDVPNNEQITVSCSLNTGSNDSSSIWTITAQLYSGETSKGTAVTSGGATFVGTKTISGGSWTSAELADVNLVITATGSNYSASTPGDYAYLWVYGATLTVTFPNGYNYTYTLTNITTDHTIVVTDPSPSSTELYLKVNGSWVQASKVYKKVSGSWVEQSDLTNVFDSNTNYIKS